MTRFEYERPADPARAHALLREPGAVPMGGGTDLLVAIDEGIVAPRLLVDLRRLPGAGALEWRADGSLRIGAAVRIAQLAADAAVREHLPALAEACEAVGSPALRTMGTLGGNLCQRPRCWYFRGGVHCRKAGGDYCPAFDGESQYHAILGGGPCFAVNPSDPAVSLVALDAMVQLSGPNGTRDIAIGDFFVLPDPDPTRETVIAPGEMVTAVEIPAASMGGRQRYVKLMQRGAWDFAVVSLAAIRRPDGAVRLVLGGVAHLPWRVAESVEEDVASGSLADEDLDALADRALYDARPLAKNAYKVMLAKTLLRDAMAFAAAE
jgi:xanthine dehydrogenase YagS FAD-binding subunit